MSSECVIAEQSGAVLIVTINRPHVLNACDLETSRAINAAMDRLDGDSALAIGIITGAGGNFSAGADLKAAQKNEDQGPAPSRGGFGVFKTRPHKPLIAAVEGYAIGGGLELCLACDLIVASSDAKMGLPEVKRALVARGGGLFRLPRRIPYHIAMELSLTGDLVGAELFHRLGMINRLVEPGTALSEAIALAEKIAENAPSALAASTEIARRAFDWTDEEAWDAQQPFVEQALSSEDRQEGLRAFAEKRRPVWSRRD